MYEKVVEVANDLLYSMRFLEAESKKESKKADILSQEVIFWSILMFIFDSYLIVSSVILFFLLNSIYKYYLSGKKFLSLTKRWEVAINKLGFISNIDL